MKRAYWEINVLQGLSTNGNVHNNYAEFHRPIADYLNTATCYALKNKI